MSRNESGSGSIIAVFVLVATLVFLALVLADALSVALVLDSGTPSGQIQSVETDNRSVLVTFDQNVSRIHIVNKYGELSSERDIKLGETGAKFYLHRGNCLDSFTILAITEETIVGEVTVSCHERIDSPWNLKPKS